MTTSSLSLTKPFTVTFLGCLNCTVMCFIPAQDERSAVSGQLGLYAADALTQLGQGPDTVAELLGVANWSQNGKITSSQAEHGWARMTFQCCIGPENVCLHKGCFSSGSKSKAFQHSNLNASPPMGHVRHLL